MLFASFATAYEGGIPKKIKNGVIKKPPPTPNKPDKIPTAKLRKNITGKSILTPAIGRKKSITINYYSKIAKSMV